MTDYGSNFVPRLLSQCLICAAYCAKCKKRFALKRWLHTWQSSPNIYLPDMTNEHSKQTCIQSLLISWPWSPLHRNAHAQGWCLVHMRNTICREIAAISAAVFLVHFLMQIIEIILCTRGLVYSFSSNWMWLHNQMQLPSNIKYIMLIYAHPLVSCHDAVTSHMLTNAAAISTLKIISRSVITQAFYQLDILLQGLVFNKCAQNKFPW